MDTSFDKPARPVRQRIVVGFDGSPGSRHAVAWALEAAAADADVTALAAFPVDFSWTDIYLSDPRRVEAVREDTRARATALVDECQKEIAARGGRAPSVDVVVVPGHPAENLVQQSRGADLLLVGSRGRGGVPSTLLGSVALHCSAHARCPVVVVHPAAQPSEPRVVVGLDDSPRSRTALRLAADQALRLGARLEVVVAYQPFDDWSDLYAVMAPPAGQTEQQALGRARQIVADVLGEEAARVPISVVAEMGQPRDVLVRRSAGARLLVVGSLSRSRLEGMVLGSVALHCALHAACPVIVAHPQRSAAGHAATDTADANAAASH